MMCFSSVSDQHGKGQYRNFFTARPVPHQLIVLLFALSSQNGHIRQGTKKRLVLNKCPVSMEVPTRKVSKQYFVEKTHR